MRFKALLLMTVLLFSPGLAQILTDSSSYEKGETIVITGSGYLPGELITLLITNGFNILSEVELVAGSGGGFTYEYPLSFLDPSGSYTISDGLTGVNLTVIPTRDSSYYLVTFLSPLPMTYELTEDLLVRVNITSAGLTITSAEVSSFTPDGERVDLVEEGNGVYYFNYTLMPYSAIGERNITVLVEKAFLGGERSLGITVNPANLRINLIEPKLTSYDVGSTLPVKFSVAYPNGTLIKPNVSLTIAGSNVDLSIDGDFFSGNYTLIPDNQGLIELRITALDEYNNQGQSAIKLTIAGLLTYLLISNLWWISIIVAAVVIGAYFGLQRLVKTTDLNSLKKKRRQLINRKKGIQEDYYVNKSIDRNTFNDQVSDVEAEITSIDEQIKLLKRK